MNSTGVEITAGLGGFLVLFALAMAVWFLGRDLTRRLRRMQQSEDRRLAQEASPPRRGPQGLELPKDGAPKDGSSHESDEGSDPIG